MESRVGVSPGLDVGEVLGTRDKRPSADAIGNGRSVESRWSSLEKLTNDPIRDARRLAWVHVSEQHQVAEQNRPVLTEPLQQSRPVEIGGHRAQQVVDIRPVIAL